MILALKTYKGKLDALEKKLSKMGTCLNAMLDDQEKLAKSIETKLERELKNRNYTSQKLPGL